MKNILEILFEKYPDKNWGSNICSNPNLTIGMIKNHPDHCIWNWKKLTPFSTRNWALISKNSAITMEIIENNPHLPWDFFSIAENPNLTLEFVDKFLNELHFNQISGNPGITMENLKSITSRNWWKSHFFKNYKISPYHVSQNPNITMEMVKKFHMRDLDWYAISSSKYLTLDIIEKYPKKCWSWNRISANLAIPIDVIKHNPNKPWCWEFVISRPDFTIEMFNDFNIDLTENVYNTRFALNPNITWEDIKKYNVSTNIFARYHYWYNASKHRNITMEIINDNPTYPWNYIAIARNPNITLDFIEQNINKMSFREIGYNTFNVHVYDSLDADFYEAEKICPVHPV